MTEHTKGSICPRCGIARVHRSRTYNRKERAFKLAGGRKRRCHECGFDFFQWGGSVLVMKDVERLAQTLARYLTAAVFVALLLLTVRWVVIRMADPAPSGNYIKSKDLPVIARWKWNGAKHTPGRSSPDSATGLPAMARATGNYSRATLQL